MSDEYVVIPLELAKQIQLLLRSGWKNRAMRMMTETDLKWWISHRNGIPFTTEDR